ncbi:internalin protein [Colletotrichum incanum]|uniref:Internalin protein n=1 Tax=Colletotrichum incanum TaxID=1573173 RepID=A0A167BUC2_COLIC|nr:internalin protein [Colletotrichum incanum]
MATQGGDPADNLIRGIEGISIQLLLSKLALRASSQGCPPITEVSTCLNLESGSPSYKMKVAIILAALTACVASLPTVPRSGHAQINADESYLPMKARAETSADESYDPMKRAETSADESYDPMKARAETSADESYLPMKRAETSADESYDPMKVRADTSADESYLPM